jgi:hypothetical protein|tara:strand:+ start:40 stop:258 length:219 start_codon:yes stop_codon:yes gene_type:complete
LIIDNNKELIMKTNITKGYGIPLHLMDEFKRVNKVGGGTRLVKKNPSIHDICYTDFVRDNDGNMVLKSKTNK